ncbi:putative DNA mismatch repair enzyme [Microbacterium sp. TS-1]|uniref:ATP-binding protein n=1 Tax=Microbacterium sp. TS-1 TaxID=1344956 RepID=UPI00038FD018|nr:ATP-binding protein [Microbacterium sp. TS-1]GAD34402.1 putative DNA mismatch repair enzyme [Microbacterium sp. TS-1]
MDRIHRRDDSLVMPANFIRAVRESGYLNVSSALAELVDNSLQAGATLVDIRVDRDADRNLPRISIEDNGGGMDTAELAACLRFGGSSRFDARDSFGRFGMGLPAASLSQARRIEVTAWRPGSTAQSVTLDVDAVATGHPADLAPSPGTAGESPSGCRVVWHDCDRIEYQRLAWLERALHKDLGRMFRRFLTGAFTLRINGSIVEAFDPTMLSTTLHGHTARLAFEPLHYEIATVTGSTSHVTVTFTMLPVAQWHNLDNTTKRRRGIIGGSGGVSILRAGREIANGWHLMGGKRKENYDDWWRCEIEFHPALDEHFGITVNKQGIRPSATLREALEPELESVARILNARVRQAFEEVKFEAAVQGSCRIAGAADADLPVIRSRGRAHGALSYRLGANQLTGDSLFDLTLRQRLLDVTMNTDHPGYTALYRPLQEMGDAAAPVRTALDLLLLSFARSIAAAGAHEEYYRTLLLEWGTTYGRMLEKS